MNFHLHLNGTELGVHDDAGAISDWLAAKLREGKPTTITINKLDDNHRGIENAPWADIEPKATLAGTLRSLISGVVFTALAGYMLISVAYIHDTWPEARTFVESIQFDQKRGR